MKIEFTKMLELLKKLKNDIIENCSITKEDFEISEKILENILNINFPLKNLYGFLKNFWIKKNTSFDFENKFIYYINRYSEEEERIDFNNVIIFIDKNFFSKNNSIFFSGDCNTDKDNCHKEVDVFFKKNSDNINNTLSPNFPDKKNEYYEVEQMLNEKVNSRLKESQEEIRKNYKEEDYSVQNSKKNSKFRKSFDDGKFESDINKINQKNFKNKNKNKKNENENEKEENKKKSEEILFCYSEDSEIEKNEVNLEKSTIKSIKSKNNKIVLRNKLTIDFKKEEIDLDFKLPTNYFKHKKKLSIEDFRNYYEQKEVENILKEKDRKKSFNKNCFSHDELKRISYTNPLDISDKINMKNSLKEKLKSTILEESLKMSDFQIRTKRIDNDISSSYSENYEVFSNEVEKNEMANRNDKINNIKKPENDKSINLIRPKTQPKSNFKEEKNKEEIQDDNLKKEKKINKISITKCIEREEGKKDLILKIESDQKNIKNKLTKNKLKDLKNNKKVINIKNLISNTFKDLSQKKRKLNEKNVQLKTFSIPKIKKKSKSLKKKKINILSEICEVTEKNSSLTFEKNSSNNGDKNKRLLIRLKNNTKTDNILTKSLDLKKKKNYIEEKQKNVNLDKNQTGDDFRKINKKNEKYLNFFKMEKILINNKKTDKNILAKSKEFKNLKDLYNKGKISKDIKNSKDKEFFTKKTDLFNFVNKNNKDNLNLKTKSKKEFKVFPFNMNKSNEIVNSKKIKKSTEIEKNKKLKNSNDPLNENKKNFKKISKKKSNLIKPIKNDLTELSNRNVNNDKEISAKISLNFSKSNSKKEKKFPKIEEMKIITKNLKKKKESVKNKNKETKFQKMEDCCNLNLFQFKVDSKNILNFKTKSQSFKYLFLKCWSFVNKYEYNNFEIFKNKFTFFINYLIENGIFKISFPHKLDLKDLDTYLYTCCDYFRFKNTILIFLKNFVHFTDNDFKSFCDHF